MNSPGGPAWRPSASRVALEARARLLAQIRGFFTERGVLEVETPLLSHSGTTDLNIESHVVEQPERLFLRTSPEFAMKRLLASGSRDIFELGRVFRAGEAGRQHNTEFTLLEWYRLGWNYLDLANETVELTQRCGTGSFDGWAVERLEYRELFRRGLGLDPYACDESECRRLAKERGIRSGALVLQEWLDLLLSHVIQPALDRRTITIVHDFPAEQSALSRVRPGDPPVAERFEVFLGGVELANGYQELTDAAEQRRRFERDARARELRDLEAVPPDEHLLQAMQHGLPECAGVALGVDRLLMAILELDDIAAVLAFPHSRA